MQKIPIPVTEREGDSNRFRSKGPEPFCSGSRTAAENTRPE